MTYSSQLRWKVVRISILAVIGAVTGFVLSGGGPGEFQGGSVRKPARSGQLIAVEPLPLMDGEMCQWMPASASTRLAPALWQQERSVSAGVRAAGPTSRAEVAERDPLRVIRDPYPAYSAVAVDPIRDEVIMTDENLFSILVYNRLDNTPPGATMTEPKRRIQGENTRIEFQCGVYIGELSSLLAKAPNQLRGLLVTRLRGSGGLAFAKIALAICSAVAWILGVE